MTDGTGAVYVYGVMSAADASAIEARGVASAPVRVVAQGDLAALTSDISSDALAAAREVRAHWRVLEDAFRTATVLPTRFGTVMESDEAVRDRLLAAGSERLEELLSKLAGCVQLNVNGDYDEARLLSEVVKGSPAIAALRKQVRNLPDAAGYYERIRLGELVAAEVARRREADAQLALDVLTPLAVDVSAEEPTHPQAAFKLAFLVERDRERDFTDGVNGLAAVFGDRIAIRYVGPLPPHSFADADLTTGTEAWA